VSGWKRRNLLLILKEALHNIIRHAKATLIEINIKIKGNQIVLAIKDNGVGIDLDKIERKRKGLTTMPKRAKKIDGIFEMDSKPLAGTLIKVIVPISSSSTSKLPHWIKTLFNKKELSKSEKINA
ncbi:MAG: ATP-binding protein, partial [Bacteroidota bacterium]